MRRTIVAAAAVALLSTGCGGGDDNSATAVPQLNGLTGATKDVTVEFHEGTNMAARRRRTASASCSPPRARCGSFRSPAAMPRASRRGPWSPRRRSGRPTARGSRSRNTRAEGNYHIWTIAPDGADAREITSGPRRPRAGLAADGSGLVFSSDRSNDGQYKIWSWPGQRRRCARVTNGPGAESNPVVSPDGQQIVFVDTATSVHRAAQPAAPDAGGARHRAGLDRRTAAASMYQAPTRSLTSAARTSSANEDLFPFPVRCCPTAASCTRPTARSASAMPPAPA